MNHCVREVQIKPPELYLNRNIQTLLGTVTNDMFEIQQAHVRVVLIVALPLIVSMANVFLSIASKTVNAERATNALQIDV